MSNWWSQRLSNNAGQKDVLRWDAKQPAPSPQPPATAEPPQPPRRRLQSQNEDYCPGCNSTNYMAPTGMGRKRCYDCGYPISQSGTGVGGTSTEGPSKRATQVEGGGYNPKQIVGRIE